MARQGEADQKNDVGRAGDVRKHSPFAFAASQVAKPAKAAAPAGPVATGKDQSTVANKGIVSEAGQKRINENKAKNAAGDASGVTDAERRGSVYRALGVESTGDGFATDSF